MTKDKFQAVLYVTLATCGVDILNIDYENEVITVAIPEKSHMYEMEDSKVHNPNDLAVSIKDRIRDLGIFGDPKVKYKTKPINWTKEMQDEATSKVMKEMFGGTVV